MKTKRLTLIPLSVLALGALTGCNKGNTKLLNAAKATIEKVNAFNKTIGDGHDELKLNSNNDVKISYSSSNKKDYCDEQTFGFYIYNNIHYALNYFYGNQQVSLGKVIKGTTRRMADLQLQKIYDDNPDLPDSVLAAKVSMESKNNKTVIDFQADWDFRSDKMKTIGGSTGYTVILTNGRVTYNESDKKTERLSINYYFSNDNRSFGSFTMDYLNDKFYFLDGGGSTSDAKDIGRWGKQTEGANATIHDNWNNGTLTPDILRNYAYDSYEAFTGKISTDLNNIDMVGFKRWNPEITIPETGTSGDEKTGWENKVAECYAQNKDLSLRKELLDLNGSKDVEIDRCPKYAEAKTSLYWLYNDQGVYTKSILPFKEKSELIATFENLAKDSTYSNDQKNLINNAKSYVNSLNEKDYFCKFDNENVSLTYQAPKASGKENYRYNTFKVSSFNYHLQNKDKTITVDF